MQTNHITYKKAAVQDVNIIHLLAVEIWNEHYPGIISQQQIDYMLDLMYSKSVLTEQIKSGHEFYIAYINNNPVGYIAIHEEESCNWFIDKFYVKKNYRNKKLGERIFEYVEKLLKERNIKKLRLFVNRQNYKSINFYFKCGFIIEKTIDKPIGKGFYMNDFIMFKNYPI